MALEALLPTQNCLKCYLQMTEANPDIAEDWESAQGAVQLQTGMCTWEGKVWLWEENEVNQSSKSLPHILGGI